MPPKCKTSEAAANNGALDIGVEQPHRDEDLEQTLSWIEKGGRLDAKRLAKRLPPDTARGLVDGSTDPAVLADTLIKCLKERTEAAPFDGTVRLTGGIGSGPGGSSGKNEKRAEVLDLLGYVFTRQALSPLGCDDDDDDLQYEFYCDFKISFGQATVDCQPSNEPGEVLLTKNVKQAFDKTCLSWEGRLTATFLRGHPRGAFRRSCKLFNASLEDFDRVLQEDFHSKADFGTDRKNAAVKAERLSCELNMAAIGISQGHDQVTKTCWECNNATLKKINKCSECSAALYCGRACQVKAWKSGHKKACQYLKEKHEIWKDSVNAVDTAHGSGLVDGLQLRASWDYKLLGALCSLASPYEGSSCEHQLGGGAKHEIFLRESGPSDSGRVLVLSKCTKCARVARIS